MTALPAIVQARTDVLLRPRLFSVVSVEREAGWAAKRFREELAWIEQQESNAFSALRTNPLEFAATWDVAP